LSNRHLLPPLTDFVRERFSFAKLQPANSRKISEPLRDNGESLFKIIPIEENQPLTKKIKLVEENNYNLEGLIDDNEKSVMNVENNHYLKESIRGSGKSKSSLDAENHSKNKNVQRNLYECKDCKKRFTQQSTLTRHAKVAHQLIKYSCSICNQQYVRKDYLTKHMKKKH
jgi:uncharacterized Zn-finger protein